MKSKTLAAAVLIPLLVSCGTSPSGGGGDGAATAAGQLYVRTQFWTGGQLDVAWLYLSEDGVIVRNPVHGADPIDLAKEEQDNKSQTGRYVRDGDRLTVTWGDGTVQDVPVKYEGGEMTNFDGGITARATPFPADTFGDVNYSGRAAYDNVSNTATFAFTKDGTFESFAVGAIDEKKLGKDETSGSAMSAASGSGRYSVRGNTVMFDYTDGKRVVMLGEPYDMGGGEIILGSTLYKKVEIQR